jgi:hypothetical protein
MRDESQKKPRQAWTRPVLQRLDAGSAETGTNLSPDSGPQGQAAS